jgi:hypothetical protein
MNTHLKMDNKEKELLLIDLCGRLPHGLILERISYKNERFKELSGYDFLPDGELDNVKPILYPLSSFTKEITIKGKTFIPKEEMEKAVRLNTDVYELRFENKNFVLYDKIREFYSINDNCLFYFDLLNKWHIDYRGLINKGLATDVNTLKNNPYE